MGALGNQVVLQAGELETIWESGNECSYILFVSFVPDTGMYEFCWISGIAALSQLSWINWIAALSQLSWINWIAALS